MRTSLCPTAYLYGPLFISEDVFIWQLRQQERRSSIVMVLLFSCFCSSQATGLTKCPSCFSYQFPLFHNAQFHFVPWKTVPAYNNTMVLNSNFTIPQQLQLDNQTLQSLDETYNKLNLDYTRCLKYLNNAINNIHEVYESVSLSLFVYDASAFTAFNFIVLCFMYCVLSKRNFVNISHRSSASNETDPFNHQ